MISMRNGKDDQDCVTSMVERRKERMLRCIVPEIAFCQGSWETFVSAREEEKVGNFFSAEHIFIIARLARKSQALISFSFFDLHVALGHKALVSLAKIVFLLLSQNRCKCPFLKHHYI